nr:hypothetical protein [uncultured Acetatifactor sp.]
MKTKTLKILLVVEFVITVFVLYILLSAFREGGLGDELFREFSPDGKYELVIEGKTAPNGLYSAVSFFKVKLCENKAENPYIVWFRAQISDEGGPPKYEAEWMEDGVRINLYGRRLVSYEYILPFKTAEDAERPRQ